jgi:hypothetical protein
VCSCVTFTDAKSPVAEGPPPQDSNGSSHTGEQAAGIRRCCVHDRIERRVLSLATRGAQKRNAACSTHRGLTSSSSLRRSCNSSRTRSRCWSRECCSRWRVACRSKAFLQSFRKSLPSIRACSRPNSVATSAYLPLSFFGWNYQAVGLRDGALARRSPGAPVPRRCRPGPDAFWPVPLRPEGPRRCSDSARSSIIHRSGKNPCANGTFYPEGLSGGALLDLGDFTTFAIYAGETRQRARLAAMFIEYHQKKYRALVAVKIGPIVSGIRNALRRAS